MFNRDINNIQSHSGVSFKPSRFNFIHNGESDLKLYNSYTGKITKFKKEQTEEVNQILKQKEIPYQETKLSNFLYDEGYLVRLEVDELKKATAQKIKSLSTNRTLELIILPNEDCNFRCVYCYEDFLKQEMKAEIQVGIINFLRNEISNYDVLAVSWFGGEPLMSSDIIINLSKEIINICEEHNVQYIASITTNGYYLRKDLFEELLSLNIISYQITLDGTEETHNKYRIGRNGEETFKTIFNNLIDIKDCDGNFAIVIRSNVNQEVITKMEKYIDQMAEHFKDDARFFLHFVSVLNLKGEQSADVHLCDSKDLFPFYQYAKERGFDFDFYKQYLEPTGSECYASKPNSFVIGTDGMIYKCTVAFNNPLNHVADLKESGEMIIYEDRLSLWLTGGANEDPSCTKCFFRPSCQGNACPLERIEANKTPCPPIKKNLKKYLDIVKEDTVYA